MKIWYWHINLLSDILNKSFPLMYFIRTFLLMFSASVIVPAIELTQPTTNAHTHPPPPPPKCMRTTSNLFNPKIDSCAPLLGADNGMYVSVCASLQWRNTDTLKCVCQLMDENNDQSCVSTRRHRTMMIKTHVGWIICHWNLLSKVLL